MKRIRTIPMDREWKKGLQKQGMTKNPRHCDEQMEELKQTLLSIGGEAVVIHDEPDLEKIMTRSELMMGDSATFQKGNHNRCHENAGANFSQLGDGIMTGYALAVDGAWRQHSWNLDKKKRTVIETTVTWVAYFGFVLDTEESRIFAEANPVTEIVRTALDDDFECRDFILIVKPDNFKFLATENGHIEILLKEWVSDDILGATIWVVTAASGRFDLTASLSCIEEYETDDEADFQTRLASEDIILLEPPIEITDEDVIRKLKQSGADSTFIEIADEGPEITHLRSLIP